VAMFVLQLSLWLFGAHLALDSSMFSPMVVTVGTSLFWAAVVWLCYLAIEPLVRRYWPQTIISWSRVLAGRIRDPLVGRDVLLGVLFGLVWSLILEFMIFLLGRAGDAPSFGSTSYLGGARSIIGALLVQIPSSIRSVLLLFVILFAFKAVLRKNWLALIGFVAIQTVSTFLTSHHVAIEGTAQVLVFAVAAIMVLRFGLVVLSTAIFSANSLLNVPLTFDTSAWYFPPFATVVGVIVVLAAWGFHTSLAGKPLFKEE